MATALAARTTPEARFDVVVIGGGINGTSAARELAACGYKILLAEQADFANGASSRSSRILHCGLRYFETHHPLRTFARSPRRFADALRMAKAAMEARAELVRLQPERCKPFTMCFPLYFAGEIRGWHLDLGFALLKRLGPADPPLEYHRLKARIGQKVPFARHFRDQQSLRSMATYREYIIDWPDRICVDAALEAEQDGAEIRLFTKAAIRQRTSDGEWVIALTEQLGRITTITAPIVLNMAGTWIDAVNPKAGRQAPLPLVRGTKGAHLVVQLPPDYQGFGVAALHRGGMPFYCLPLDGDRFYFGPTETLYDGDASNVSASDEDIDFLLGEANYLLPGLNLARRNVEFTWAGVRPLTSDPQQPMGRRTREIHDLAHRGLPGILAMTAGPVMSHRSAGREIRAMVSRMLKPSREPRNQPTGSSRRAAAHRPDQPLFEPAFREAVIAEHARDLKGVLYTRTGLAWGRHLDRKMVEEAANCIADLLGWSSDQVAEQVLDFLRYQETVFRSGSTSISLQRSVGRTQVEG